jgi:hypothetical protein
MQVAGPPPFRSRRLDQRDIRGLGAHLRRYREVELTVALVQEQRAVGASPEGPRSRANCDASGTADGKGDCAARHVSCAPHPFGAGAASTRRPYPRRPDQRQTPVDALMLKGEPAACVRQRIQFMRTRTKLLFASLGAALPRGRIVVNEATGAGRNSEPTKRRSYRSEVDSSAGSSVKASLRALAVSPYETARRSSASG